MSDNNSKAQKVIPIIPLPGDAPAAKAAGKDTKLVSLYAAHKKIYPRSVTGLFNNWRWAMVVITQLVFYGLPWLEWGQRQAVLFDLGVRRFYIFGLVLYPQDFIYLTGLLVIAALSLFLFTAVAGRLWCGYACPQTVYTEMFLWIEKKLEGDRSAHMRRDAQPLSLDKAWRKTAKHLAWLTVALWTGFTFVGYFTPIKQLAVEFMTLNLGSWEIFWSFFYSFATYGNAGFMREQVCLHMCPYARFQSAMFDKDTLIVTYDSERGEPRGTRSRKADLSTLNLGSCVDCSLCVQVCPTGIDIRKGLQYECIGCGACVDVCDTVMDKMDYPRGLIRYSTENALKGGLGRSEIVKRAFRPRTLVYSAVFLILSAATAWSLTHRPPLRVDIVRDRGVMSREADDGSIENVFHLQLINTSEVTRTYAVSVAGIEGIHLARPETVTVPGAAAASATITVRVGAEQAENLHGARAMRFTLADVGSPDVQVEEAAKFWLP